MNKRFRKFAVFSSIALILASTLLSFIAAPKTSALGETYTWQDANTIVGCGSGFDTAACAYYKKNAVSVPGQPELFSLSTQVHWRGCWLAANATLSYIYVFADNKSGEVTVNVANNSNDPGFCPDDPKYEMKERITISGTRGNPNPVGTNAFNYEIRTSNPNAPPTQEVSIKAGHNQQAGAPNVAAQTVNGAGAGNIVGTFYKGTFQLKEGDYTLCAQIIGCQNFHMNNTVTGATFGEYQDDRTVTAIIGSGISGLITAHLKTEDGNTIIATKTSRTENAGQAPSGREIEFTEVNPGKYQLCVNNDGTFSKCEVITKEAQRSVSVTFNVDAATGGDLAPELNCTVAIYNPLTWLICPLVAAAQAGINLLSGAIDELLNIDTNRIFNPNTTTGKGFYDAWKSFRNLAIGLIVIAGLVMVIAQAAGMEFLDAYTIRRVLPRLIVAIIFITLSWPVLQFLVDLSNNAGVAVRALIYLPFKSLNQGGITIDMGSQFVALLVGSPALFGLGLFGLITFVVTIFISVLMGFVILYAREAIVMFCVVVSPFAIACSILPNTERVWTMWRGTLITMLLLFPILSGFIAICRVFSVIFYNA